MVFPIVEFQCVEPVKWTFQIKKLLRMTKKKNQSSRNSFQIQFSVACLKKKYYCPLRREGLGEYWSKRMVRGCQDAGWKIYWQVRASFLQGKAVSYFKAKEQKWGQRKTRTGAPRAAKGLSLGNAPHMVSSFLVLSRNIRCRSGISKEMNQQAPCERLSNLLPTDLPPSGPKAKTTALFFVVRAFLPFEANAVEGPFI